MCVYIYLLREIEKEKENKWQLDQYVFKSKVKVLSDFMNICERNSFYFSVFLHPICSSRVRADDLKFTL